MIIDATMVSDIAKLQDRLVQLSREEPTSIEEYNSIRMEFDKLQLKLNSLQSAVTVAGLRQTVDMILQQASQQS
jgi:regulator of replication initiation timing